MPDQTATITVLVVEPDGTGHLREIPAQGPEDAYHAVRGIIDGWLQQVQPSTDGFGAWSVLIDEEGKLRGLPANPVATMLAVRLGWEPGMGLGAISDHLVGTAVFVGHGGARWRSLPDLALVEARVFYDSVPATLHEPEETA